MTSALMIKPLAESTFGATVENLDVETAAEPNASPDVWDELHATWIEYYLGHYQTVPEAEATATYQRLIAEGHWHEADYPPPPHKYPMGVETPKSLPSLTKALLDRGYSDDDTRKILGMNWVSMYDQCWGIRP